MALKSPSQSLLRMVYIIKKRLKLVLPRPKIIRSSLPKEMMSLLPRHQTMLR